MQAVVFDVIRRYLEFRGYAVEHIQNFTDIDDKMIDAANRTGVSTQSLAAENTRLYFDEMDALNVLRAHAYPRATQEIPKILEMIEALIDKGFAYAVNGDVYFRVRAYEGYGKLSNRSLDSLILRVLASTWTRARSTRQTSPCGRAESPASPSGRARGVREDPAGTSSAARCL